MTTETSAPSDRDPLPDLPDLPNGVGSPLPRDAVGRLNEPVDERRVKSRQGRGGGKFSYLEGQENKRVANRIFGYGGWGYTLVELVELTAVEIQSKPRNKDERPKAGWHVGYRALVRFQVTGCEPITDVGYGDATEYGWGPDNPGTSRVTAQELAMKEACTDALKRSMVAFGDQFGLILYAKDESDKRRAQESAHDVAETHAQTRARGDLAMDLKTALSRLALYTSEEGAKAWIREAYEKLHDGKAFPAKFGELPAGERLDLLGRVQNVVYDLESEEALRSDSPVPVLRAAFQAAFARRFDGLAIQGPAEWELAIPF